MEPSNTDLNPGEIYTLAAAFANYNLGAKAEDQVKNFVDQAADTMGDIITEVKQRPSRTGLEIQLSNLQQELFSIKKQLIPLERCCDKLVLTLKSTHHQETKKDLETELDKIFDELCYFNKIKNLIENKIANCNRLLMLIQS